MRHSFLITNLFAYSSALGPAFYTLWIYWGSGNANFFYAITLLFGLGQVLLFVDSTYALMRREFERLNPDLRKSRAEIAHGYFLKEKTVSSHSNSQNNNK